MKISLRPAAARALLGMTMMAASFAGPARGSDGVPDTGGLFPAVGGYYEFFVYLPPGGTPEVAYAELSCTGSLVAPQVLLTAAHCTAYNYTEDIGLDGYSSRVWVSFDVTASANDFRCFLAESGVEYSEYLVDENVCRPEEKSVPAPTFLAAAVTGRNKGVAIAHGLTHPDYLRPTLRRDGRATRAVKNLQLAPDVGAVLLEQPVTHLRPLPVHPAGALDAVGGLVGTPSISVGYGLNWSKRVGTRPSPGLGPMTDLGGGSGTRRIARVGPITNVFQNSLIPRQDFSKGDDTVCFGDSGSPLFLQGAGTGEPVIAAVLSGATNWCQGSKDPYYRMDRQEAQNFMHCVIEHQHDPAAACRKCSAERYFDLCD